MDGYYIKKVGQNKGAPRIWLDGPATKQAGFRPGQRYDVVIDGMKIVLQANPDGSRVVSAKRKGEAENPVIDLNSQATVAIFDGMAAVRVVVKDSQIHILPLATELKKRDRMKRLREQLETGDGIDVGSLSHGVGILSHAFHSGLRSAGIRTRLAFANEIREELLEHASVHNDAWNENTQILAAPMQELAFDKRGLAQLPKVTALEMGLPCSGASKAGRSKRHLQHPEAHPEVGHLVVAALVIINQVNPAIVLLENVVSYSTSASADILRNQLRDMGYETHERVLQGKMWGSLENRDRWCLVAVSEGIQFDFDQLVPPGRGAHSVQEIIDPSISENDSRWRRFDYLKDKEIRDLEKGNGFSMQIVRPEDNSVPTLRKGYHKGGSTDPLLAHPSDPDLLRQFSSREHAAIKQVPPKIVEGLSETVAHQALGQGIIYQAFEAVGKLSGEALLSFINPAATRDVIQKNNGDSGQSLQEILGLHIHDANVVSGRYSGILVSRDGDVMVQDVGRNDAIAHKISALDQTPKLGNTVSISYREGKGTVRLRESQQLSLGLG